MAVTTTASLTFEIGGHYAKLHLPRATSLAALKTFAQAFAAFTEASITEVSFTQSEDMALEGTGTAYLGQQGMCLLHGEVGKTQSKKLLVFAPKSDLFELSASEGSLIKRTKGMALAAAYSALTGETFTFIRGRLS